MEEQVFVFVFKGTVGGVEVKGSQASHGTRAGSKTYRVLDGTTVVAEFEAAEVVGWWRKDAANYNPSAGR